MQKNCWIFYVGRTMKTVLPLICCCCCIVLHEASASQQYLREAKVEFVTEETCPPCELLFSKLVEGAGEDGKMTQVVKVQERGEPKSGTGMMFDWATGALVHTCEYLQGLFGEDSCRVDMEGKGETVQSEPVRHRAMIFEPELGGSDAKCSCPTVERVTILVTQVRKHDLPVDDRCAYRHWHGVDMGDNEMGMHADGNACTFQDGTQVESGSDLWQCMDEADCDISDDWQQMVVFRDPRPVTVSAYFFGEVRHGLDLGDLEEFVASELPRICQWVAIRYIFFSALLPHQSEEFWYEDALAYPLEWHYRYFNFVGLQLPLHVVEATAQAAAANDFSFNYKKFDKHPGEETQAEPGVRRFEDEVSAETLELADATLRQWLPPVLLAKLGVEAMPQQ